MHGVKRRWRLAAGRVEPLRLPVGPQVAAGVDSDDRTQGRGGARAGTARSGVHRAAAVFARLLHVLSVPGGERDHLAEPRRRYRARRGRARASHQRVFLRVRDLPGAARADARPLRAAARAVRASAVRRVRRGPVRRGRQLRRADDRARLHRAWGLDLPDGVLQGECDVVAARPPALDERLRHGVRRARRAVRDDSGGAADSAGRLARHLLDPVRPDAGVGGVDLFRRARGAGRARRSTDTLRRRSRGSATSSAARSSGGCRSRPPSTPPR